MLDENSDIVLLDYHSPDGLEEYILSLFDYELQTGKLKYFKMVEDYAYTSAYAKNVVHKLAGGDFLFNLDGDNFINGNLFDEIRALKDNEWLVPKKSKELEGSYGRLGYSRQLFWDVRGYDETIVGMLGDDGAFNRTLIKKKFKWIYASQDSNPIQNTREQKDLYVNNGTTIKNYYQPSPPVNYPDDWGKATVIDINGKEIRT